jgi:hypothetical protein
MGDSTHPEKRKSDRPDVLEAKFITVSFEKTTIGS